MVMRSSGRAGCGSGDPAGSPWACAVTGSSMTRHSMPKTSRTQSSVITSRGWPGGDDRALAHRDQVVGVAGGQVEVVQHHHDRGAAGLVEVARAGRAPRPGGRRRGTSSARRAAAGRSAGRAPSRSRPAGADRRRARRRGGRRGRGCRSARAPRRPPRSSVGATSGGTRPGAGAGRDPTRSTTVTPSGVTGFCGSRPRVRATWRDGSVAIAVPSSSTAPDGRAAAAGPCPRSSVDLPQALAPTITVIWPSGTSVDRPSTTGAVAVPQR